MPTTTAAPDSEDLFSSDEADPQEQVEALQEQKSRLDEQTSELEDRLSRVEQRIEEADPNTAVDLRMERQAVEATLEDLRSDLDDVRSELKEARQKADREEDVAQLVRIAEEADEARKEFWQVQDQIIEAVKEHAPDLQEARQAWFNAHFRFRKLYSKLEKGAYEPTTMHKDDRQERIDSAEQLVEELRRRGAPIEVAIPNAFCDSFQWTGVNSSEAAPEWPERHQSGENRVLDEILNVAPLDDDR